MEKLIFDMDGTLADSMGAWSQTLFEILHSTKVSYPDNIGDIITPMGLTQTAHYFRDSLGMKLSVEEILYKIDSLMADNYANSIVLKDNAEQMLRHYRTLGHSLNILTASPHRLIDSAIARWGIAPLFDNIWSCEDLGLIKSNPEIYGTVASLLGAPPSDCCMHDDNITALRTAKQAGFRTVGVYDYASRANEQAIRELCDKYIYNFSELI